MVAEGYHTMSEKKHTRFATGGIYRRQIGEEIMVGSLIGSKQMPNGIRQGTIITAGFAPEKVVETKTLDDWELIEVPVPVEMFESLKRLVRVADGLEAMVADFPRAREIAFRAQRALEDAGLRDPDPEPEVEVEPEEDGESERDRTRTMDEIARRVMADLEQSVGHRVEQFVEQRLARLHAVPSAPPRAAPPPELAPEPGIGLAPESGVELVHESSLSSKIADIAIASTKAKPIAPTPPPKLPAGTEEAKTELAKLQSRKRAAGG